MLQHYATTASQSLSGVSRHMLGVYLLLSYNMGCKLDKYIEVNNVLHAETWKFVQM